MSDIPYKNDRCPYCETPYGADKDENGRVFCDCLEAENKRLTERLAVSQAEVERLRGIIQRAEFINAEFHGDGVLCDKCAICEGYAMDGHTEDCPFYHWEAKYV